MGLLRTTRVTTEQETLTAIPTRRPVLRSTRKKSWVDSFRSHGTEDRFGCLFGFFFREGKIQRSNAGDSARIPNASPCQCPHFPDTRPNCAAIPPYIV